MFRGRRRDRHGDEVVDSDEDTGGNIQKKKRGRKRNVNEEGAPRAKRCVCAHSCMHVCVCVSVCMHVLLSCHHHSSSPTDKLLPLLTHKKDGGRRNVW